MPAAGGGGFARTWEGVVPGVTPSHSLGAHPKLDHTEVHRFAPWDTAEVCGSAARPVCGTRRHHFPRRLPLASATADPQPPPPSSPPPVASLQLRTKERDPPSGSGRVEAGLGRGFARAQSAVLSGEEKRGVLIVLPA